jgi:large subunit ribosomal protein L10
MAAPRGVEMPTQAKMAEVDALVREWTGAQSVVLADYGGMDVATISELRRRCRAEKVGFRVAKNTLSKRALEQVGMGELGPMLAGPIGIAVSHGDEMAAVRVLTAFAKEKEKPRVKGGIVQGRLYTLEEIKALASLPPRNELLGQLLMTFQAPTSGVVGILNRLTSDLVSILDQLAEKRGGGAAPAPAAATEDAAGAPEENPAADAAAGEASA